MAAATPAVVDTDVVSFLFKSHSLASTYQAILDGRPLAISLFTLAEIEYGMEVKNWGAGRRDLMRRFPARFTTLLPDTGTARVWARIKSGCENKGRPITFADAWIAAAAVQLNIPLATHNATDFEAVDGLVIDSQGAALARRSLGSHLEGGHTFGPTAQIISRIDP